MSSKAARRRSRFFARSRGPAWCQHVAQQPQAQPFEPRFGLLAQRQQRLRGVEEGVGRGGFVLLRPGGEKAGAKQLGLAVERDLRRQRVAAGKPALPFQIPLPHRVRLVGVCVECRQAGEDRGGGFAAVRCPDLPRGFEGGGETRLVRHLHVIQIVRPDHLRQGLGLHPGQQLRPTLGGVPVPCEPAGESGRKGRGGHVAAPEVGHRLAPQLRIVLHQFDAERQPRGEGGFGQGALAEAVDGEDGGLVERLQRRFEQRAHLLRGSERHFATPPPPGRQRTDPPLQRAGPGTPGFRRCGCGCGCAARRWRHW